MIVKVLAAGTHADQSLWQKSILLLGGDDGDFGLESGLRQLPNTVLWKHNQEFIVGYLQKLCLSPNKPQPP